MIFYNTIRKIKKSFGRYLSLLLIIAIGVGFYAGIQISIPNISDTQNSYYKKTNLMDVKLQSTIGFTDEDILAIEKLEEVDEVVGSYSKTVLVGSDAIKLLSIEDSINKIELIDGRMPTNAKECLADSQFYKVGDVIKLTAFKEDLKNTTYTVVGTIISPLYTSKNYGIASIGNGQLYSFLYIPKENFLYEVYTEAYVTALKTEDDVAYSDSYTKKVNALLLSLDDVFKNQILQKDQELESLYGPFYQPFMPEIKWYQETRDDVVLSYKILESQYKQVTIIANVIPIFFIVIVALMTSNTMSRMINEERGEMGTFASLGFSNQQIIHTYFLYVLSSTILGTVIGYFLGTTFLPQLVYQCFPVLFPEMEYHFHLEMFFSILFVVILVMMLVTIYACNQELKSYPSQLLRPESPKTGKKILLERITFLWNRFSFSLKVTMRNLSRYRGRGLMTLIGAAGCTFLILIGFAIRDSINTIGDKQYNDLFQYDNMVILSESITELSEEFTSSLTGYLDNPVLFNQSSYKVVDDNNTLDISLMIPENKMVFEEYFLLQDVDTKETLSLTNNGVIVTPKVSDRFHVSEGDTIVIEDTEKNQYQLKIIGITENYVSNYIYMSKEYYQKIFKENPTYNSLVAKSLKEKEVVANHLLNKDEVLSVYHRSDLLETANEGVSGLNNIVVLLVVISSMLAFTVLYNLTSINISERTREIATLKVLGFTDKEANDYIYRETLIMVVIGIIVGLLLSKPLHGLVIDLLEVDNAIFLRTILKETYFYSAGLTFFFAIIMQGITYIKLKYIDMISSLKSVE